MISYRLRNRFNVENAVEHWSGFHIFYLKCTIKNINNGRLIKVLLLNKLNGTKIYHPMKKDKKHKNFGSSWLLSAFNSSLESCSGSEIWGRRTVFPAKQNLRKWALLSKVWPPADDHVIWSSLEVLYGDWNNIKVANFAAETYDPRDFDGTGRSFLRTGMDKEGRYVRVWIEHQSDARIVVRVRSLSPTTCMI